MIARDTFFDFGPPFNYFDIFSIKSAGTGVSVERVAITPAGDRCAQPPAIEVATVKLNKHIKELLQGKNPCTIPERDLRKAGNRQEKSLALSGVNVTMRVSCSARVRNLRMGILGRDLYAEAPKTPVQTSWTMSVLKQLDQAIGPGPLDKPMFNLKEADPIPAKPPESGTIRALREGEFDSLFGSSVKVSDIYRQALEPQSLPSVLLRRSSPDVPASFAMPKYPPTARAAHLEGTVTFTLQVNANGNVTNLAYTGEPKLKLLWAATADAVNSWQFRPAAVGHQVQASVEFRLNCPSTGISKDY